MLPTLLPSVVPSHFSASPILAMTLPNGVEWIVIGVLGLLIFGKRLPAAARGLGESYREFRRGLSGSDDAAQIDPAGEGQTADTATPPLLGTGRAG